MTTSKLTAALVALALATAAQAQDLVHTPVNPNFGGNTFNYQWLLQSATVQNGLTDPDAQTRDFGRSATRRSSLDDFSESLNRQLLNSITRELFDLNLGGADGGLQPGSYSLGNFQVDVLEEMAASAVAIAQSVLQEQTRAAQSGGSGYVEQF